jgi:hypothetical protein
MRFTEYPSKVWEEILPGVQDEERDLVRKLVVYESADRLTAAEVCCINFTHLRHTNSSLQALQHPYFNGT